ncbi:MAG: epimerase [Anaerolineae bacterium]|nr:epimerase [Anaerolineae bacterium]
MKILILGGTQFVGRHITQAALDGGHQVTLFNRGQTNPELFPDTEKLVGDRSADLSPLEGYKWDTVIDINGYLPQVVTETAKALVDHVSQYVFISTVSVYADFSMLLHEDSPLIKLDQAGLQDSVQNNYGGLKVLCERAAEAVMPGRVLVIRPGYVIGPYDHTDRFTYWLARSAQGGEMLAPGGPQEKVQGIDGRDLAAWTLRMVEAKQTGIYNATGQTIPTTWGEVLECARQINASDTRFTWISEEFAREHNLFSGRQLPMWDAGPEHAGIRFLRSERAVKAGLTFRPITETIRDTLAWHAGRGEDYELKAGLTPERERELLQAWKEAQPAQG